MICKLCGIERALVKAHIIPESFFRSIKNRGEPLRLMSVHKGVHTKKSPNGVYDEGILCGACENTFGPHDDYASKVLLSKDLQRDYLADANGSALGYFIHGIDYKRFKLFFLSVLWRAAVSSHVFFNFTKLGPHFRRLDDLIRSSNPGSDEDFSVTLWEYQFPLGPVMVKSHSMRMDGINFYAMPMGRFVALIKVDKRPYPVGFCRLERDRPLAVTYIDFKGSRNEKAFWEAIKNNGRGRKGKMALPGHGKADF